MTTWLSIRTMPTSASIKFFKGSWNREICDVEIEQPLIFRYVFSKVKHEKK